MRIVSLLPSATEIVYALGLDDQLEGVTDECEIPPSAARPPRVVVQAKQPPGLTAAETDDWVREHAAAGGLYVLDDAAIAEIVPELVLTQDLCRVCAVPTGDVDAALARVGCPARVVTLEPSRLDEVIDSVQTVADAAGVPDRGRRLVAELRARLASVARAVAARKPIWAMVLEWLDPPYTAGHWVPDVIRAAGAEPLNGAAGGHSVAITWDHVRAARPDLLILAPCGIEPTETVATWADTAPADLRGIRALAVELARPGPGLVDRVEALAAVLHPEAGITLRPDLVLAANPTWR